VLSYYWDVFKVDSVGAVALMGAHTIGAMSKDASGFSGQWKVDQGNRVFEHKLKAYFLCTL